MPLAGEQGPNEMDPLPPDPLLNPGALIDPHPSSNGNPNSDHPGSTAQRKPSEVPPPSEQKPTSDPPPADGSQMEKPDWLPPGWIVEERVRASGASAGTRDKYYKELATNRRFRSKKEVLLYLETGSTLQKRKKNPESDADTTQQPDPQTSNKKNNKKKNSSETKAKDLVKNFNFDNVPAKVKWELTDVYEGTWRPLLNSVDEIPESSKHEWTAAFTYLTLQNNGSIIL